MSDYLRDRFPLAGTSTVYMSGKAVYNLVRHDRPGIIASVELLPHEAEEFQEAISNAITEAAAEALQAVVTPEAREHWDWTQERRARSGDEGCVCTTCGLMASIEKGVDHG